jgi:EAL domain-containing protein (putative c-di-GMP-specific phosphodiesterase class I)/ActR/RegA family two-component response regulator
MNTPGVLPRLLVLDDDPVMREIIAVLGERQGFESRMVATALDFFAELARWQPTHISLDLVMPLQDGIEVLRELANRGCQAAIIIISSMEQKVLDSARRVAVERGLNICGVLTKPFKHESLRELLGVAQPSPAHARRAPAYADGLLASPQVVAEALREDQFVLHFQPKVRLTDGEVVGVEALVRWEHPLLGLVPPDRFITELERNGAINQLTQRVIERGLAWFATSGLCTRASLAMNLSALDLGQLALADALYARCAAHAIETERVVLELTESSAMQHPETALATLTRLRIKGFGLAIDDFGTGYSSMVQLARMPFSSMKVDKSFVMSMTASAESRKIVASIISLGHALGLNIVAEGVDSVAVARLLHELGCDTAQGYLVSKPLDAASMRRWLVEWRPQAFVRALNAANLPVPG